MNKNKGLDFAAHKTFMGALKHVIDLAVAGQSYFDPIYSEHCTLEGCYECEHGIKEREKLDKQINIVKDYLKVEL